MFTPLLNYLSDGEVERTEKEKDKELNKRRKRNTRGRRGIVLPDRDPIRTYRTPAIGFPELDAATLALQAAANAPTSRRAAAAAASLTIASIVTSENRDDNAPFMPQSIPFSTTRPPVSSASLHVSSSQVQQQHQQKEKKGNGFFKAPPFPASVLRPRAHVAAPTLSTAGDASNLPPSSSPDKDGQDGHLLAQDGSRFSRLLSAKRAKELEKEAKEKEFIDGQHPNYINGVWHCSNCGCPESIAVGRRKGPLGDKSQCGTCGMFLHSFPVTVSLTGSS
jgi:SWI/SNF-related matrix-associated actin-dependent regulator of chromatin subfamily B protein 1